MNYLHLVQYRDRIIWYKECYDTRNGLENIFACFLNCLAPVSQRKIGNFDDDCAVMDPDWITGRLGDPFMIALCNPL